MRKIKFRAWWKDTMKPIPNFTDDYVIDACNEDIFIVCQYTGLKDKNGVEIYEGDIVRCVNGHIGEIEWEAHDCCFNVTGYYRASDDYPTMAFMEGQPFEVIGNIYENPELLEAE